MKYVDFDWDCSADGIVLDAEFNSDRLGWRHGDYFKFINVNGRQMLVKVCELENFLVKGAIDNGKVRSMVEQSKSTNAGIS